MAQKSEEIMPDPDAIIRHRRDRLLGANLTGRDVNFSSSPPSLEGRHKIQIINK